MANYQSLLNSIASTIKTNGNEEITGAVLQGVLQSIVTTVGANYTYIGVATTSTNPGTPPGSVFYLTATGGTYTNFGGIVVTDGTLTALKWDSTAWSKEEIASLGGGSASDITYDNTSSGLTATDVQNAIDELASGNLSADVIRDNYVQLKNGGTSVYPKTNEYIVMCEGKNLLDLTQIADGFVNKTDGTIAVNTTTYPNAKVSPLIPVRSGEKYTLSGRTDVKGIVGYTSDNTKVKIISGSSTYELPDYNGTFTVPSNVVAIRFTVVLNSATVPDVQLEYGETATTYEAYEIVPLRDTLQDLMADVDSAISNATQALTLSASNTSRITTIEEQIYSVVKTPDFTGTTNLSGTFNNWLGFSLVADLEADGILKSISFNGTAQATKTIHARLSKKTYTNDVLTGLTTITQFTFTINQGESEVDVYSQRLEFKKDYVLELNFGDFGSIASTGFIKYTSNSATGDYARFKNQTKESGSMYSVNANVIIPQAKNIITKKTIKILSVGNSYAEDAFSYAPFIIRDCYPNIDLTLGILYFGGCTLQQHEQHFDDPNDASYDYRKITPEDNAWTSVSAKSIQYALADDEWDIIVFQQKGEFAGNYSTFQPYLNSLIRKFYSVIQKPVKFGWHIVEPYKTNLAESVTQFEDYAVAGKKVIDETLCEVLFPSGTAMQNARTTSLQTLGDAGNLMHTSSHAQEGIPCYVLALPNAAVIASLCGESYAGIYGDSLRPNQTWVTGHNIPNQNGTSVGVTDYNCQVSQMSAIMAIKNPYAITDLTTLDIVDE